MRLKNAAQSGGIFDVCLEKSALAELGRATGSLEAVLRAFLS